MRLGQTCSRDQQTLTLALKKRKGTHQRSHHVAYAVYVYRGLTLIVLYMAKATNADATKIPTAASAAPVAPFPYVVCRGV